jgi:cytoskeletal protein CcmA (bactofilin family)
MNVSFSGSRTALNAQPRGSELDVPITGSATVNGAVLTLHGTFSGVDTQSATLQVSGDISGTANAYSFNATVANPASATSISGHWTGPANASGDFVILFVPTAGSVTVYCGSFTGSASGAWNLVVSNSGQASGNFSTDDGLVKGALTGSIPNTSNGTGTVSLSWGANTNATGPIAATTAGGCPTAGTWHDASGGTGCWAGSSTGR